ncbi:hypothetical protein H310_14804 [Aphanomyces invadans]|uniref:Uncharacterized protein n=1 Tax=Aphanomyces invadans TaxID=157072 RepID=A0A024T9Y5_9STRA|nr:hypothetical protein H310_14804 [Aphanomyces invadans]ETV90401.1 hypothetical protein H310_14804 [Aphanomyces invadans]|eukprot:XP_008880957.1 hypothetical protein H310_14804 [Aphanomyces invadans]
MDALDAKEETPRGLNVVGGRKTTLGPVGPWGSDRETRQNRDGEVPDDNNSANEGEGATRFLSTVVPAKEMTNPAVSVVSTAMDPASPAVFSMEQIEAIQTGDWEGIPDSKHVDVEERLYPLSAADIERQVKELRALRWDVTHQEIVDLITATLQRPLTKSDEMVQGRLENV